MSWASNSVSQLVEVGAIPEMLKTEVVVEERAALPVAEVVAVGSDHQFPDGSASEFFRPDPVVGRLRGPREYHAGREVIRGGHVFGSFQSGLNYIESLFAQPRTQEKFRLFNS